MKKRDFFQFIAVSLLFSFNPQFSHADFYEFNANSCNVDDDSFERIMHDVKKGKKNVLASLSNCMKTSHQIVFRACLLDPSQLEGADNMFRDDENFVSRLIKIHPQTLLYVSDNLKKDKIFVEKTTYLNRDSLKYAEKNLRDNFLFMKKMIENDSRNYIYATSRIKASTLHASLAFKDDGRLIMYAPDEVRNNKKLAKIAMKSNIAAYDSLGLKLQKDKEIIKMLGKKPRVKKQKLEKFLQENYVKISEDKNIGEILDRNKRIFKDNAIIDRIYVTKWLSELEFDGVNFNKKWWVAPVEKRNYPNSWKDDMKDYPILTKKIEKFFLKRFVDEEIIDNLSLVYLWKVKDAPLTLSFKLYLISPTNDHELGQDYANITALTAIAQKISDKEWRLSVVDANFNSEMKMQVIYEDAHKQHQMQDLYVADEKDKNPKVIFLVEDEFDEYFEIFEETKGEKYRLIYRLNPLKIKGLRDYNKDDFFFVQRNREEQEYYEWSQMMEKCKEDRKCAAKLREREDD